MQRERIGSYSQKLDRLNKLIFGKKGKIDEILRNKEVPFIENGSIDYLAGFIIETLFESKKTLNVCESFATSGKISDALTNNVVSGKVKDASISKVFKQSSILSNAEMDEYLPMIKTSRASNFSHQIDANLISPEDRAMIIADARSKTRTEDIILVTTGNILAKNNDVNIALSIKDGQSMALTIKNSEFEKEIYGHKKEYLKYSTLNSLKKQYVAHRAFVFLLEALGKPTDDLPKFKPRKMNEKVFKYRTDLIQKVVNLFIKFGLKAGTAESSSGGRITDAFTDVVGGEKALAKGGVFYNEGAKESAGVNHHTLKAGDVYTEVAAFLLADTIKDPGITHKIAFLGLYEIKDYRSPDHLKHEAGENYLSIISNIKHFTKQVSLYVKTRIEMKELSVHHVFEELLQKIIEENKDQPHSTDTVV